MLLKEWDSLHATLELVDQPIRLLNALRILEIGDILDDMYNRLDHYNKHGVLPPVKVFPIHKWDSSKPFDVAKRRNTLRTYVTREKKLIRDARTDATRTVHKNLLIRYQLESVLLIRENVFVTHRMVIGQRMICYSTCCRRPVLLKYISLPGRSQNMQFVNCTISFSRVISWNLTESLITAMECASLPNCNSFSRSPRT